MSIVRVVSVTRLASRTSTAITPTTTTARDQPFATTWNAPTKTDNHTRAVPARAPRGGGVRASSVGAQHDAERRPDLPRVVQEHRRDTGGEHHAELGAGPGPVHHRGPGPVETEGAHAIGLPVVPTAVGRRAVVDHPGVVEDQHPVEAVEQVEVVGHQHHLLRQAGTTEETFAALRRSSSVVGSSITSTSGSVTSTDESASSCF